MEAKAKLERYQKNKLIREQQMELRGMGKKSGTKRTPDESDEEIIKILPKSDQINLIDDEQEYDDFYQKLNVESLIKYYQRNQEDINSLTQFI